jgi:hypothetical protein
MSNQQGNILTGFVILLVIAGSGIYYLTQQTNPSSEIINTSTQPLPTPNPSTSPVSSQTASSTPQIQPTKTSGTSVPGGWVEARNTTFSIKYPDQKYEPNITEKGIGLKIKGTNTFGPTFTIASNFSGGSRRDWYLNYHGYSSEDVGKQVFFTEKILGSYSVLEIRLANEKVARSILVTKGNILIEVLVQDTDLSLVETITSTLTF